MRALAGADGIPPDAQAVALNLTAASPSEPGFVTAAAQADGSYYRNWGIYAGGTAEPATEEAVREGRTTVRMLERYPPEVNHEGWPKVVRALAANGGFEISDIDLAIFTQVRKPSIELVMDEVGIPWRESEVWAEMSGS